MTKAQVPSGAEVTRAYAELVRRFGTNTDADGAASFVLGYLSGPAREGTLERRHTAFILAWHRYIGSAGAGTETADD